MHRHQLFSRGLRRKRGAMNKNEEAYSAFLEEDPKVFQWWFEPFSLKLTHPDTGRAVYFTPDFLVLMEHGLTYIDDVKPGRNKDGKMVAITDYAAGVRIKCAADKFPLWTFRLVLKRPKKLGGGWEKIEV